MVSLLVIFTGIGMKSPKQLLLLKPQMGIFLAAIPNYHGIFPVLVSLIIMCLFSALSSKETSHLLQYLRIILLVRLIAIGDHVLELLMHSTFV